MYDRTHCVISTWKIKCRESLFDGSMAGRQGYEAVELRPCQNAHPSQPFCLLAPVVAGIHLTPWHCISNICDFKAA